METKETEFLMENGLKSELMLEWKPISISVGGIMFTSLGFRVNHAKTTWDRSRASEGYRSPKP